MYIVLTLCVLLFAFALCVWHRRNICGHKLPPALPGALPIVGHNHVIYRHRNDFAAFLKYIADFSVKSGGVIWLYFGNQLYYIITDIEDAATVANVCIQKHFLFKFGETWLGKGLITASGATYTSHRKLLNPAFSLSVAYGFLDVFNDQSRRLTNILDSFVGQGSVDTSESFKNATLRTSCITILGAHDEKDNDFINTYTVTINSILQTIGERLLTITLHSDFLFGFSSLKKKQDELIKLINGMIQETIERRKEEIINETNIVNLSEPDVGFRSFIDIMLEIATDGSLSDQDIMNELNTFAAASYETTSRQLVSIMVLLGTYPDLQEKLYQEVLEMVGDRDLDKENISKLVYTEAFIKECMRVVPVANVLPRYVERDLKLKNYTLRAGTSAMLFIDGLHRQPAWGSNPNKFKPERWLEKGKQLDNLQFGFGYGQRMCTGKKYAMVSMKVTVAHIVRKFRIKGDFNKMKMKFEILMRPESGHEIVLERRNTK